MKHALQAAGLALIVTVAQPALAAGFTGPLDPSQFSTTNVGSFSGAVLVLGSAAFTPTQLTLVGSDAADPGCTGGAYATLSSPCELRTSTAHGGTYSFNWAYTTVDGAGAAGDIFGVVVDGTHIALSDPGAGAAPQGGSSSFTAATSFGWFLNCTDCTSGNATAIITNAALVPEASTTVLLLAGLLGMANLAARRHRA